jgi:glycosyltransferase involved in cell wall biosynthesis
MCARKLSVCLVYGSGLSTNRGGGIATKIRNIVKELHGDVDFSIFTTISEDEKNSELFFKKLGVTVYNIPKGAKSYNLFIKSLSKKSGFDIVHLQELPFAWNFRFDLMFAITFILKPNFRHSSLIYEHQIATEGNLHPIQRAMQLTIFKALVNLFGSRVIANSAYMFHEALTAINKKNSNKIQLIPNGIDIDYIQRAKLQQLKKPSILFFGHLSFLKGADLVMKAFLKINRLNPHAHLYLIGDGPLRAFCEELVEMEGLQNNIHILGAKPQDILFGAILDADLCILPSRNDAAPYTVLEAMAAGKPIVTTKVGGIPKMFITGRNGLLVDPDPEQLAAAIQTLLEDEQLCISINKNNLQDISSYKFSKIAKQYLNLYKSIFSPWR